MPHALVLRLFLAFFLLLPATTALADAVGDINDGLKEANRGNYDAAIRLYTRAINAGTLSQSNLSIAHNNRGVAYKSKGDMTKAEADYTKAIEADPKNTQAIFNRAFLRYMVDDYQGCVRDYDMLIALKPSHSHAHNNRALAVGKLGDQLGKASGMFKATRLYLDQAFNYLKSGDPDKAIQYFDYASNSMWQRGLAFIELKRYRDAEQAFDRSLELNPKNNSTWEDLADLKRKTGGPEQALKVIDQLVRHFPESPEHYLKRADFLKELGRNEAAEKDHSTAAALLVKRANNFMEAGDPENAVKDLDQALTLKPDLNEVYYLRGMALVDLDQSERALNDFIRAAELDPKDYRPLYEQGNIYSRRGEYAKALNRYEVAVALQPEDPAPYNGLVWLLATCPEPALRNGKRALEAGEVMLSLTGEDDPFYLDTMAAAYAEAGLFDQAVAAQSKSIRILTRTGQELYPGSRERLELFQQNATYQEP